MQVINPHAQVCTDAKGRGARRTSVSRTRKIIDASIVPVPKQRNSRDDNARIKDGETPEGWENQPAKRSLLRLVVAMRLMKKMGFMTDRELSIGGFASLVTF